MSARTADLASPFGPTWLPRQAADDFAGVLKALADPSRLTMLSLLHRHRKEGVHVAHMVDLLGTLSVATVSHHLGVLVAAGMVNRVKEGPYAIHRLNVDRFAAVAAALKPPGGRR